MPQGYMNQRSFVFSCRTQGFRMTCNGASQIHGDNKHVQVKRCQGLVSTEGVVYEVCRPPPETVSVTLTSTKSILASAGDRTWLVCLNRYFYSVQFKCGSDESVNHCAIPPLT